MPENKQIKERDESDRASEQTLHYRNESTSDTSRSPEGFRGKPGEERSEEKRPREMLGMSDSYGNVSISASRDAGMVLSVNKRRNGAGETLGSDSKTLKGERRRDIKDHCGRMYTNNVASDKTAFAMKTSLMQPPKRIMHRVGRFAMQNNLGIVKETMPFVTLRRDKGRLAALSEKSRELHENDKDNSEIEREKELLRHSITQKEQQRDAFEKKMQIASVKARSLMSHEAVKAQTAPAGRLEGDANPPDDDDKPKNNSAKKQKKSE